MNNSIKNCRVCGNDNLKNILNLGSQYLTGIFPQRKSDLKSKLPLELVKCHGKKNCCNLVQLRHNHNDFEKLFGLDYGYNSSLNPSMVEHLRKKVRVVLKKFSIKRNDFILDIGSNDATTLSFYPKSTRRIGFDPIGNKFKENYKNMKLINDYFSYELCKKHKIQNVKVINSFAMFYDLEDPNKFCNDISKIIDKDSGILVLEQCYLPSMLANNCYDTICHEHLAYYSLTQINYLAAKNNLKVINFEKNNINGGSFSVIIAHKLSKKKISTSVKITLKKEVRYKELSIFKKFANDVVNHKKKLRELINELNLKKKKVFAIGASTKGNVILQYCELNSKNIKWIGEVNQNKFKKKTPGSWINIIDENELLEKDPDYLLILPWHFRKFFLKSKKFSKINLIFPLPKLEIINK